MFEELVAAGTTLGLLLAATTAVGVAVVVAGSRWRAGDEPSPEDYEFSVCCTIRSEDEETVLGTARDLLSIDGVEEFVVADDTPDGEEGLATYDDGAIRWYKRRNRTDSSQQHVSLNIAKEHVTRDNLVVMDVDTSNVVDELGRWYSGQAFAVGKVLPEAPTTLFGLFEKIDTDVRQHVYQAGRHRLGLCPNLSGCFYLARREPIRRLGYRSPHEDFVLTLDLYRAGYAVSWLDTVVASQEIPDSARELARRRTNWFEVFLGSVPAVLGAAARMPAARTAVGILLYPLIWYLGGYSLLAAGAGAAWLAGPWPARWALVALAFVGALWAAGLESQRLDGAGALDAVARGGYYVGAYLLLLVALPVFSAADLGNW